MTTHVLFNELSGNGTGKTRAEEVRKFLDGKDAVFKEVTKITDYKSFFGSLAPDDEIILCGGDGTLNHFINDTEEMTYENPLYYYPTGSGNDFWNDLGKTAEDGPVRIEKYLKDLPFVEVNGRKRRFLNGIGYGIDGYCCEVGDRLRAAGNKKIDYTGFAIKGLLFHFKPAFAKIEVDNKKYAFEKVWLAPTMNGRCYGGGMIATPSQDRLGADRLLSLMVFYGCGRFKTLAIFPSIFKGTHINHKDVSQVITGHKITVSFDHPVALQIDGETVLNVTSYTAYK